MPKHLFFAKAPAFCSQSSDKKNPELRLFGQCFQNRFLGIWPKLLWPKLQPINVAEALAGSCSCPFSVIAANFFLNLQITYVVPTRCRWAGENGFSDGLQKEADVTHHVTQFWREIQIF